MISILLLISFSIHIVVLIVIWKLMNQLNTLKNHQPEGIIDIFETYLDEIKEENRQLQSQFVANKQSKYTEESENKTPTEKSPSYMDFNHDSTAQLNEKEDEQEDVSLSFEANVLHLRSQGLTVEEIAKKLNRGKTEVMLIVKFYNENK